MKKLLAVTIFSTLLFSSVPVPALAQTSPDQMSLQQMASLISSLQTIVNSLKSKVAALKGTSSVSIAQAQTADITTGLVGHWKFDETSGTTAADSSGNGRTGTLTNGPMWTAGKIGNAVRLDGSNDYISVSSVLDIPVLSFAVSVWVNPSNFNDWGTIVGKRTSYSTSGMRFNLDLSPGSGSVILQSFSSSIDFSYVPPLNAWTHLAVVVRSGATDLYVNGVLNQTLGGFTLGTGSAAQVRMGNAADGPDQYAGSLDDMRIYARTLSVSDISAIYALGSGSTPPPLDTQAPTVPTNLSASAISSSQINLSWNASTDNVGVTDYRIYRGGTQIATVSGTSYSDTGLSPSMSYSYTVAAYDAATNVSSQSSQASATTQAAPPTDIQAPSTPSSLSATVVSSSQIYLSWSASTDNVGVTGYRLERCTGASCTNFVQISTPSTNSYYDIGLAANTTYRYQVRATDAAGNLSGYSGIASATTQASGGEGIPAALGWYQVPNSRTRPVCATDNGFPQVAGIEGCPAVTEDWNGGIFDSQRNRLVYWGGGHNGYYGNELYAFDLDTLATTRLTDPGLPSALDTGGCPSAIANGTQPNSRHTYDGLTYISSTDQFFSFGGSVACPNSAVYRDTWLFNFATNTWSNPNPTGALPGADQFEGMLVEYDTANNLVLVRDLWELFAYNVQSNSFNKLTAAQVGLGLGHVSVYDPVRRRFYIFGSTGFRYHDLNQANAPMITPSTSGCSGLTGKLAAAYDSMQDRIILWNTGNSVQILNPVTHTCTTQTFSGGPTAVSNGTYGRFQYSPASGVFTVVNSVEVNAYTLRLTSGGTPPPVDITPPTVSITIPTSGSTVSGSSVTVSVNAADNVGVSGVQLLLDGSNSGIEDTTSPYSITWNTTTATNGSHTLTVRARDAAGNTTTSSSVMVTVNNTTTPPPTGDFAARCSAVGVVKCVGFDQASDISGTWGSNSGIFVGASTPALDSAIKASGNSAIKMTIPSNSGSDTSGSYFTNFSPDLSVQFGANSDFYIQWRQRFSPEFLNTYYQGGGGWKQTIIGTGDKPGCTPSTSAQSNCYSSCSSLETVTQNTYQRGFPQMYNSCSGSTSHGPYDPFSEHIPPYDFKLQNARPSPYCLYSQSSTGYFPPNGNCFGYFPNEWMTFQVRVKTGPRVADEWINSYVELWIAREGQSSQMIINWGPYNLTAGSVGEDQKFGKVWLLPYHTGKSSAQSHPTAYTWYDELIISRNKIADPGSPPAGGLIGDLNLDRIVNSLDWSLMNAAWSTNNATADLNRDGIVNSLDFSLMNANWGRTN